MYHSYSSDDDEPRFARFAAVSAHAETALLKAKAEAEQLILKLDTSKGPVTALVRGPHIVSLLRPGTPCATQ